MYKVNIIEAMDYMGRPNYNEQTYGIAVGNKQQTTIFAQSKEEESSSSSIIYTEHCDAGADSVEELSNHALVNMEPY